MNIDISDKELVITRLGTDSFSFSIGNTIIAEYIKRPFEIGNTLTVIIPIVTTTDKIDSNIKALKLSK